MKKNDRKGLIDFVLYCKNNIGQNSIQPFLYILAFSTFGLGDALTGAFLMNVKGVSAESNAFFSQMYSTHGPGMFIVFKLWATLVILLLVFLSYIHSNKKDYWSTNGFLAALAIGGIMAVQANIQAIYGYPFLSSSKIILIFLTLVFVLIMTGDFIDSYVANQKKDIISYHGNISELMDQNLDGYKSSLVILSYPMSSERK
ncbi:MAG: hypothetical protein K0A89_11625 [ANME-2 cluster archaeon]|nr:hypothetical protein [ANME-2 cluster archaeon]